VTSYKLVHEKDTASPGAKIKLSVEDRLRENVRLFTDMKSPALQISAASQTRKV
jgi:hypothetical protein